MANLKGLEKLVSAEVTDRNIEKNSELYWINRWGDDYFDVNDKGNIIVRPEKSEHKIDLHELVLSLVARGICAPLLLRFDGIIRDRIHKLCRAFQNAIKELKYKNTYQPLYPIKVNSQKHIVELVKSAGAEYCLGLEVGSKPELLVALSLTNDDSINLCNGFKDEEYIELALLGRKIGKRIVIIIEQLYELKLVLSVAKRLNVEAEVGLRMKLHAQGSGKWASSSGDLAKFGLSVPEIMEGIKILQLAGKQDWLKLLHFHIGSQITSIVAIKKALRESTRIYVEIAKICPSLCLFDVGGGLGVDYDGTLSSTDFSTNYKIEKYAKIVVSAISTACIAAKVPHPQLMTESGRAIVAHHSVLITEIVSATHRLQVVPELEDPPENNPSLIELCNLYKSVVPANCQEFLTRGRLLKESIIEQFLKGDLGIAARAYADLSHQYLVAKIRLLANELTTIPDEIEALNNKFLDTYFANFSLFQSLPDIWGIQQIFPVMPIHRLGEEANRRATIVDLTCDSDGKIDRFVSPNKASRFIPLHELNHAPYYIGIFLIGAYQEIMGSYHNLFGDTHAVHVDFDKEGNWEIIQEIPGNAMHEVLASVQYQEMDLLEKLRNSIESSQKKGTLTNEESAKMKNRFKDAFDSYTYLILQAEKIDATRL
jgi:arginine decarboxylase